jgi:hypothetical protein
LPDDSTAPTLPSALDFNSIEGLEIRYVTLDATGFATTTINLIDPDPNDPNDGVVRIMAAVVDQNGQPAGRMGAGITVAVGTGGGQVGDLVTAVNIGGGPYTAVESGINYVADPGPGSGTITYRNLSGDPIGGTQDDVLYQTYGFGDFSYALTVPEPGNYVVQIELIEPFWQAAGSRLFDVALEGSVPTGFDDIDIYARAGGQFQALTLTETVTVSDGTLDIDFNGGGRGRGNRHRVGGAHQSAHRECNRHGQRQHRRVGQPYHADLYVGQLEHGPDRDRDRGGRHACGGAGKRQHHLCEQQQRCSLQRPQHRSRPGRHHR